MSTAPLHAPLVARTIAIPDPGALLDLLPAEQPLAWVRRGEGLIGWGEVLRIETAGKERITDAADAWASLTQSAVVRDEVGLPGCGPVAFGSFAFSPNCPAGGTLIVPEVVVGRLGDTWWMTSMSVGPRVPSTPEVLPQQEGSGPGKVTFRSGSRSEEQWQESVAEAISRITQGDLEKVVLARDVVAESQTAIELPWLLRRLGALYDNTWTFCVDGLLGATPELLLRSRKQLITSRVLAGTIQRTGNDEKDLALAGSLARSSKDLEEHEYAVESVAQALAPHCSSMNVPETPFVLHLSNVMHLATDVTGVLMDNASSLDLASALHPSAAVCGTPTQDAFELIESIEGMQRGRYAGPVGWIDASGDGEWGIALRCGQMDDDNPQRLRLFAGCGIVAGSDPQAELAESVAKLLPMRQALSPEEVS